MTNPRRNRRKQDLSSSKINQSSSSSPLRSSPRNIPMTQYRTIILPKSNKVSIDGSKTLKNLVCDFQNFAANESTAETNEEDPLADEKPGHNGKELRSQKLIKIKTLHTSSPAGEKHKCPLCQIYTPTTSDLVNHLFFTHAPRGVTCPVCRRVLSRRDYLKDHLCTHVGHKPLNCPGSNCTKSYLKRAELRKHFDRIHKGHAGESLKGHTGNRVEVIDLTPHTSYDSASSLILTTTTNDILNTTTTCVDDPVTPASADTKEVDDHKIKFKILHCSKCSKKFLYYKNLQAHREICHAKKRTMTRKKQIRKKREGIEEGENSGGLLKCPLCTTEFVTKVELSDHLWESHVVPTSQAGKKTDCPLCGKKYPTDPSKLKAHILFTHAAAAQGEHECPTCGKKFYRACNLSRHVTTHERIPQSHECQVCGKNFAQMCLLNFHMRGHTKDYQYSCPVSGCGQTFLKSQSLKIHQFRDHPKEGQSMPHICKVCGKGFVIRAVMKAHEAIHMDRPFRCAVCHRRFVSESEHLNHQQKGCKEKSRFQCHICEKSYKSNFSLKSHLRFHAGDAIVCTVAGCKAKFYDKVSLAAHLRDHEKIHKCPESSCGKICKNSSNLTYHLQTRHPHLVPEKLTAVQLCPVCGKSVLDSGRLKKHMTTHTNERPHKCHLCESAFKEAAALRHHLRIHAKDKSHPCTFEGCSKSFYTAQNLEKHRTVHTGEKKYLCPECGKSFAFLENLKKHLLIHSDERPFQCQFCDKAFKQPQSLKTHQTTHA